MTYALGPDHVHVTVSYMYNKFKKNECKQGQLIIASWAVHFQNELFSERFCLKPVTSGHTIFGVDEQVAGQLWLRAEFSLPLDWSGNHFKLMASSFTFLSSRWWYHNKYRATRGNRSEHPRVRKSPRCHVNTPPPYSSLHYFSLTSLLGYFRATGWTAQPL